MSAGNLIERKRIIDEPDKMIRLLNSFSNLIKFNDIFFAIFFFFVMEDVFFYFCPPAAVPHKGILKKASLILKAPLRSI